MTNRVPVIGRGPGYALYTGWGYGGRVDAVFVGADLPAVARLREPPLERSVFIRARSWEDASVLAAEWQQGRT